MLSRADLQLTARCKAVARSYRRYSASEAGTSLSQSLCRGRRSDVLKVCDFARWIGPAAGAAMVHACFFFRAWSSVFMMRVGL